jgi:hypothetical protein
VEQVPSNVAFKAGPNQNEGLSRYVTDAFNVAVNMVWFAMRMPGGVCRTTGSRNFLFILRYLPPCVLHVSWSVNGVLVLRASVSVG